MITENQFGTQQDSPLAVPSLGMSSVLPGEALVTKTPSVKKRQRSEKLKYSHFSKVLGAVPHNSSAMTWSLLLGWRRARPSSSLSCWGWQFSLPVNNSSSLPFSASALSPPGPSAAARSPRRDPWPWRLPLCSWTAAVGMGHRTQQISNKNTKGSWGSRWVC